MRLLFILCIRVSRKYYLLLFLSSDIIYKMVQSFYKNWLLVLKSTWGIWTTSRRQWKVRSWNLMGYFCPKDTFLQLEHYIPNITFNYLSENSPNYLYMSFLKPYIHISHFSQNSFSVFFLLKHYILSTKVAHQSANFQTFHCSG